MLKWTVYAKKNQDNQVSNNGQIEGCAHAPFNNITRRSLDAEAVKKSKKPSRYQRRSLGANARKNNTKTADKENLNYVGCTPNYYKEGFMKKIEGFAFKDVSNTTPTSGTPAKFFDIMKHYLDNSKDDNSADLPATPTYSRRVREAKKRKLEMSSGTNDEMFSRGNCLYRSERRIKGDRTSLDLLKLSHSTSEPSLNDLSDRLSASTNRNRNSFVLSKQRQNTICTTKATCEGLVEIEYGKDLVINCIEKPVSIEKACEGKTLPIFGHHIFMENPLYFNKNDSVVADIRPLKRTRKKSNDFESSFKSPSVDKRDTHAMVRDACSPISITPLSVKLAALRFSTMSTHSKSRQVPFTNDVSEYFPKVENPFIFPLRDEEMSTEMENKFILPKDATIQETEASTQSTVSTTQMGDVTLERMIEDIIKSTKIVKTKRRILNKIPDHAEEDEMPSLDAVKDLFVNPQAQNKANLIKEAKYVSLSRENSVSPKNTPTKKGVLVNKINDKLLKNLPIGGFILEDGYNEREVRTPDNFVKTIEPASNGRKNNFLNRSRSMSSTISIGNHDDISSGSASGLYSAANERASLRLRRQKCIRRKKSTVSNEIRFKSKEIGTKSTLTLGIDLPSPTSELQNVSLCEPLSSPFYPLNDDDFLQFPNNSIRSNVSHSSLMPNAQNRRSRELFGLTLENGIPSPITPVPNLKRPCKVLSEDRAVKTSKLNEVSLPSDGYTPVIEHRSIRRCLTYSPEESSISSSEEKRRSVASNKFERSIDRFQSPKGTIDLEIITRNDVIDVHGEW